MDYLRNLKYFFFKRVFFAYGNLTIVFTTPTLIF